LEAISVSKPDDQIPKFELQSENILEARHQELLRLFPEVHSESGGINFDALRISLGDAVNVGSEVFGMSWPGKAECARVIQRQSIATLLPVVEESVNWDTTENVIIEGDNLEVLKVLQKAYLGKVKMIYIDPPYNTGSDFIYPDNYTESLKTYLQYTGQVDDEGRRFSTSTESSGRFHSKWLNMMYPRLSLARDLLTDDGVIFVSIDDHELPHLLKLMDEIFGSEDRLGTITVVSNWKGRSDAHGIASANDYVIAYAKSSFESLGMEVSDEIRATYKFFDDEKKELYRLLPLRKSGTNSRKEDRPNMFFPLFVDPETRRVSVTKTEGSVEVLPMFPDGREGCWRWGKETAQEKSELLQGVSISGRGWDVHARDYLGGEGAERRTAVKSVWIDPKFSSDAGTYQVKELIGPNIFDFPKPIGLIEQMLSMSTSKNDLVMDFFAGSGSLAHAVMSQNQKDGGRRKFILVQLPEPTLEDSAAFKSGLKTISSITRLRVARAADGLVSKNENTLDEHLESEFDNGFRSFRLSESNFTVWDAGAIEGDEKKLEQELFAQVEHVLPGRTNQDILFELMLKSRYQLTTPLESMLVGKCEVWKVAAGEMVVVMDSGLTVEVAREIASWKPTSVVVLDRCFVGDDSLKANARKIFEDAKVDLKTV
jgi:adenine-specific DNA-methyltransferase